VERKYIAKHILIPYGIKGKIHLFPPFTPLRVAQVSGDPKGFKITMEKEKQKAINEGIKKELESLTLEFEFRINRIRLLADKILEVEE
jgi:hypothetical protein